jgi:hypothetical protein
LLYHTTPGISRRKWEGKRRYVLVKKGHGKCSNNEASKHRPNIGQRERAVTDGKTSPESNHGKVPLVT